MRKMMLWILALGLVISPAVLAANDKDKDGDKKSTDSTKTATVDTSKTDTAKSDAAKTDAKPAPAPSNAEVIAELEQMRALMKEQSDQIAQQQRQLAAMQARLDAATSANAPAPAAITAETPAVTTAVGTAPPSVNNSSAPVFSAANAPPPPPSSAAPSAAAAPTGAAAQNNTGEHSPLSFKIGDALFTPGGFMDFAGIFRTTGTGNGISTTFNGIPYNNNLPIAGTNETRFTAQNSRISLKVDAPVASGQITGYVEADFLGAIAANANVTSNSDSLRMRLYFGDYRRGKWEVLAGQDWSMLTPARKGLGVMPADVFFSQNEDTNYQVGLPWSRQPQFRVMYHPNDQWTLGVSVENPDELLTTLVTTPAAFTPFAGQLDATSGATLATPPTANYIPDIIAKVAFDHMVDGKLFHIEASGLFSEFRIYTPSSILGTPTLQGVTNRASGGGGSVNLNLELVKNLHLIANTFFSDGGGRYLLGSGPDLVVKQLTTTSPFLPSLVHAYSGIGGLEYQAMKNTLLDFYYGGAYYGRNVQVNPVSGLPNIGYGFAGSSNSNNRIISEYTVGWTQTMWANANYGSLKLITQGSYLSRAPWFLAAGAPKDAHLFMVDAALRYTLP